MKRSFTDSTTVTGATTTRRKRKLRLLIHAVDGCVPFLTPDVLEAHFPPTDDLWIGMAVRDVSVVPNYEPQNNNNNNNNSNNNKKKNKGSSNDDMPKKPRGFTFNSVSPDSWLEPYTRVTVPSFDWMQDNIDKKTEQSQRLLGGSTATNQHILVWTPHGRQKLTLDLYHQASAGLKSHYTLSLYDMVEEQQQQQLDDENDKRRQQKAIDRNKQWFRDLLQKRSEPMASDDSLWSPLLLSTIDSSSNNNNNDDLSSVMPHDSVQDISGVALIGKWKTGMETTLAKHLSEIPTVALLTTYSLQEILNVMGSGVIDTIGTDLPRRWTLQKHALAVDFTTSIISVDDSNNMTKRLKTTVDADVASSSSTTTDNNNNDNNTNRILNKDGCMDLNDKSFAQDPKPLVVGCQCLACANDKFSRAYIHHLICAKELLADILLFGHNLHHLLHLVRAFNSIGTLDDNDNNDDAVAAKDHFLKAIANQLNE